MPVYEEARHAGEFILSEANGNRSREVAQIVDDVAVKVGQVLGRVGENEGTVTAAAAQFTGTGNGALTFADPATAEDTQEGTYTIRLVEGGANAGEFEVIRPDGTSDGFATVGQAYDGQLKFTIADGSTDFAAPAQFTSAVSIAEIATAGQYDVIDPAGVDGEQFAAAIAMYPVSADATGNDRKITIIARECTVNGKCLEWPEGISADNKAAAIAALARQSIIVR